MVRCPDFDRTIKSEEDLFLRFRRAWERQAAMIVNILGITDDAKCYEMVRRLRWPDGVHCPHCDSSQVVKQGRDETEPQRQRYGCRACGRRFDDLTDTIFAGHHQPLRV